LDRADRDWWTLSGNYQPSARVAVFSLAELDPGFCGSVIIVADTTDGKPLFAYQGPLRSSPRETHARPDRSGCCNAWTWCG
jgi:hypothetical protein